MIVSRILFSISVLTWAFIAVSGISGYNSIVKQHVPGYPNQGQMVTYLVIPLGVLSTLVLTRLATKSPTVIGFGGFFCLAGILPYLLIAAGGV